MLRAWDTALTQSIHNGFPHLSGHPGAISPRHSLACQALWFQIRALRRSCPVLDPFVLSFRLAGWDRD